MKIITHCIIALVCMASIGCANRPTPLYYWGHYENLIYKMYNKPGDATPEVQVGLLKEDIQRSEANGKRVAPGLYAHLGFMYASQGNVQLAMEALNEEKNLYPESAVLIDGMISRALKQTSTQAE